MKITIEPETPEESKVLGEQLVYSGAIRACIAGYGAATEQNKTGEIGFCYGPWIALKTDMLRTMTIADERALHQSMVNAVLRASNIMAGAQRDELLAQEIMAGRNGHKLRIAEP